MRSFANIYEQLKDIVNYNVPGTESDTWAHGIGLNNALESIFGEQWAHVIHPDISSISSPASFDEINAWQGAINCAKEIGGYSTNSEQIKTGIIHKDGGTLKKPIVITLNTSTVKAQSSNDTLATGGIHWQCCVILPKGYKPLFSNPLNNANEIIFYLDSLNTVTMPLAFQNILRNGATFDFQSDDGNRTHTIPSIFPDAQIVGGINTRQQLGGSDCGWWALYNAVMIASTGNLDYLSQFKAPSREPAYKLRALFPELVSHLETKNAVTNSHKQASVEDNKQVSLSITSNNTLIIPNTNKLPEVSNLPNKDNLALSRKLKVLYATQDTLPKLIDDDTLPEQKMDDYYVNLSIQLNKQSSQDSKDIELGDIFNDVEDQKASNKILISGGAGVGKTTLLHKIAYNWGKDQILAEKFDFIFKVRLKILTSIPIRELSELIHIALDIDTKAINSNGEYTLEKIGKEEVQLALQSNRVLLLLDGYDEVSSQAADRNSVVYNILNEVFGSKQSYIMTSRPGALDSATLNRFGRRIDSMGFDNHNTKEYINKFFAKQVEGQVPKDALVNLYENNHDIRDAFRIPINLVMACFVFSISNVDSKGAGKLWDKEEFRLVDLYEKFVIQLGKRYLVKEKRETKIKFITDEMVLELNELKAIKEIAHKTFQERRIIINGQEINKIARNTSNTLGIEAVHKYGLLRIENRAIDDDLLEHGFTFIHLSFQEYLIACSLKDKLMSSNPEESSLAANYIAQHRNDPRFLVILKFLTGLVTRERGKDAQILINRLWDALVCNVDGVLEFGIDQKVTLLMHLISEVSIDGKFDQRIPHLSRMQELIDSTVLRNLTDWGKVLKNTEYLSEKLKAKLLVILNAKSSNLEELIQAIRLISKHIDKFENKEDLLKRIEWHLYDHEDWKVKIAAMQELVKISVSSRKINKQLVSDLIEEMILETSINEAIFKYFKQLLSIGQEPFDLLIGALKTSENRLEQYNIAKVLGEVASISAESTAKIIEPLIKLLEETDNEQMQINVANALAEVAKSVPESVTKVVEQLIKLLKETNDKQVQINIANALAEIAKAVPKSAPKALEPLIKLLKEASDKQVQINVANALAEIAKAVPESVSKMVEPLIKLLEEVNEEQMQIDAAYVLTEVVKIAPQSATKAIEPLIKLLEETDNEQVQTNVANALARITKAVPESITKVIEPLIEFLKEANNERLQINGIVALVEVVKLSPEAAANAVELLIKLLEISKHEDAIYYAALAHGEVDKSSSKAVKKRRDSLSETVQPNVIIALARIAKVIPESASKAVEPLIEFLKETNGRVQIEIANELAEIADALAKIAKAVPENALKVIEPLVESLRNTKINGIIALTEVVKIAPQSAPKAVESLIKLLGGVSNRDVQNYAMQALIAITIASPKSLTESIESLKRLLEEMKDDFMQYMIAIVLNTVASASSENTKKSVKKLIKLLENAEDEVVQFWISKALAKIAMASPGSIAEAVEPLKKLLEREGHNGKCDLAIAFNIAISAPPESLANAISPTQPQVKLLGKLGEEDFWYGAYHATMALSKISTISVESLVEAIVPLVVGLALSENNDYHDFQCNVVEALSKVSNMSAQGAILVIGALLDVPESSKMKNVAYKAIEEIIRNLNSINSILSVFFFNYNKLNNKLVHDYTATALIKKLSSDERDDVENLLTENVIYITDLLTVLDYDHDDADAKKLKLNELIKQVLYKLITSQGSINAEKFTRFIIDNFNEILTASSESKAFITLVYHMVLKEGKRLFSDTTKEFIIMAIQSGITTLFTRDGSVIIEGTEYQLDMQDIETQNNLSEIISNILESNDPQIEQYRSHQPLFNLADNSIGGMCIAATDVVSMRKLINQEEFGDNTWQLSLLYLSDHLRSQCHKEFLLLEQRDPFGYHVAYKITANGKVSKYEKHPHETNTQFAKSIFGKMEYTDTKPRYYAKTVSVNGSEVISRMKEVKSLSNLVSLFNRYADIPVSDTSYQNTERLDLIELKATDLLRLDVNDMARVRLRQNSMNIELSEVKNLLGKLDINILIEVIDKAKFDAAVQVMITKIQQDEYAWAFYNALRLQLNATYIACSAINTDMLQNKKKGVIGKVGSALQSISSHIPVIGVGVSLLGQVLDKVDAKQQEIRVENFAGFIVDSVEMAKFSEQIARILALKIRVLTMPKNTSMVAKKIGEVSDNITGSIADAVRKSIDGIGRQIESRQAEESKQEKISQSVEYAKRFFGVDRKAGLIGEGENKATEIAKFIIEQIFDGKVLGKTVDEKVKQVDNLIKICIKSNTEANSSTSTQKEGNCIISYCAVEYNNSILNDPDINKLFKIARAGFGISGVDELISIGNDQVRYGAFMVMRSKWGDEIAVNMMLGHLGYTAITIENSDKPTTTAINVSHLTKFFNFTNAKDQSRGFF